MAIVLYNAVVDQVLLAKELKTGKFYAVKALKKDVVLEDDDVEATMVEKRILALGTSFHYITHLHSTFTTSVSLMILYHTFPVLHNLS